VHLDVLNLFHEMLDEVSAYLHNFEVVTVVDEDGLSYFLNVQLTNLLKAMRSISFICWCDGLQELFDIIA
jgi:hypothetical protein